MTPSPPDETRPLGPAARKVVIFLQSADYALVHQGLSIAAAATAAGRPVELYFSWWALERLLDDRLDEPDFGPGREAVERRFELRQMPSLRQLLELNRESGLCTAYACTASLGVLQEPSQAPRGSFSAWLQWVGWSSVLRLTEGVADRFSL